MITTTEIARYDWMSFLDSLSHLHMDQPVRIEILRPDIGAQMEAMDLPLDGITADVKARRTTITIAVGSEPHRHVQHIISDPVSVSIARDATGEDDALEIVDADRTITLVYFDAPSGWPGHS